MRVLCRDNGESLEIFEIVDMGFDDDIFEVKDDKGNYDRFEQKCVSGLFMVTVDNEFLYIPNIDLSTCNIICRSILETGYYDLSEFDEYEVLQ